MIKNTEVKDVTFKKQNTIFENKIRNSSEPSSVRQSIDRVRYKYFKICCNKEILESNTIFFQLADDTI